MSKKITLSIGERLAAVRLFDVFKGKTSELAVLLDDVKKFVISEDEWKKANLVKTPGTPDAHGNPTESWKWDEKGNDKVIETEKESVDYLLREIDRKNTAGEITLADVALVTLEKKLKAL
jgi:hypothetical protein